LSNSHGESFLAILNHKLRGDGIYLFDEPESALSPSRQMTALASIHRLVEERSQFIIATHSPILLAIRAVASSRSTATVYTRFHTKIPSTF